MMSDPKKKKPSKPHVCSNCTFAKWPGNRAKIKIGSCYEVAGNDMMATDILRSTKACGMWEKRPVKHRKPKYSETSS